MQNYKNITYSMQLMNRLKNCRKEIDNIDKKIAELILSRFKLIKKISSFKKAYKIKILDKKRESQVINNIKKLSKPHRKFLFKIFKNMISYSKKLQIKQTR